MKKVIFIALFLIYGAYVYSAINPVANVNFKCVYPISIGGIINMGSSGNPGADALDKARSKTGIICMCPPFPSIITRYGTPLGMNNPTHILESTFEPFAMPSLGKKGGSKINGVYRRGASSDSTKGGELNFVHTHIHRFAVFQILNIFQDITCGTSSINPFDILYMSETDPVSNDSKLAMTLFPESALVTNPVALFACMADTAATMGGAPIDGMYWCVGGHSAYPMSNFQTEPNSIQDSSSMAQIKTMYRMNRYSYGKNFGLTAGIIAVKACGDVPAPQVIKSQYRLQPAMPSVAKGCLRMGAPSFLWNTPARSYPNGDMVQILWTRKDCCAF